MNLFYSDGHCNMNLQSNICSLDILLSSPAAGGNQRSESYWLSWSESSNQEREAPMIRQCCECLSRWTWRNTCAKRAMESRSTMLFCNVPFMYHSTVTVTPLSNLKNHHLIISTIISSVLLFRTSHWIKAKSLIVTEMRGDVMQNMHNSGWLCHKHKYAAT